MLDNEKKMSKSVGNDNRNALTVDGFTIKCSETLFLENFHERRFLFLKVLSKKEMSL